ncbi:MAG: hypothetical protein LBB11_03035 [Puniceicoccales bacterium]|jgi:hypothetical protein|nr:hypothetical protein [Puniceicoccales bacterium]
MTVNLQNFNNANVNSAASSNQVEKTSETSETSTFVGVFAGMGISNAPDSKKLKLNGHDMVPRKSFMEGAYKMKGANYQDQ